MNDINDFFNNKKNNIIIFPTGVVGGHELMTIAIIKKSLEIEPGLNILVYVSHYNEKLLQILRVNDISYKEFYFKTPKLEMLHGFLNIKYISKCFAMLKSIDVRHNIIVAQGDIQQGLGYFTAAKLLKRNITSYIPMAHSFRKMNATLGGIKDFVSQFAYKICDNYITISDTIRQQILINNKSANVVVIKNFVTSPKVVRNEQEVFYGGEYNIYIIGRIYFAQKGHDLLINALTQITDRRIHLHVIGNGPDEVKLSEEVKKLPINVKVSLYGWMNNYWDLIINKIDLLVIPSRFEGVPLVMLEAIERNVPVLAPARDGMKDYLDSKSTYAVKMNDELYEVCNLKLKLENLYDAAFKGIIK